VTEDIKLQAPGTLDKAKLTVGALLVVGGIVAFYMLGSESVWLRWAAVAGGLALAAVVVAMSRYGAALKQFIVDSRVELRKIVWPNKEETFRTTLIVLLFVAVSGVFFWLLDLVLAWATRAFTGQGS